MCFLHVFYGVVRILGGNRPGVSQARGQVLESNDCSSHCMCTSSSSSCHMGWDMPWGVCRQGIGVRVGCSLHSMCACVLFWHLQYWDCCCLYSPLASYAIVTPLAWFCVYWLCLCAADFNLHAKRPGANLLVDISAAMNLALEATGGAMCRVMLCCGLLDGTDASGFLCVMRACLRGGLR